MLNNIKFIYDSLPKERMRFLKNIPDSVLYGRSYFKSKGAISFDVSTINDNLFQTLSYCREYTQWGKDHIPTDFSIVDCQSVLKGLPLISSSDLAENLDYFSSREFTKRSSYITTTGGTGRNPTSILLSNESFGVEWAHIHHVWSLAGYRKKSGLKLTLRGKSLNGSKLIEFNPIYNEIVVDTFKINSTNINSLVKKLQCYPISYIHGYPSLVTEFMDYFRTANYRPKLSGVFLASEGSTNQQKLEIGEFFSCSVIQWYGQTEKVALAVDENSDGLYKIYTSYGLPRIVEGEIVATSFVNRALPLINYRTGDSAQLVEKNNCLFLKDIKGRWGKDFVYLNLDKRVPTSSINLHSSIQSEILFYQIQQDRIGHLVVKIVPKQSSIVEQSNLLQHFYSDLSNKLQGFEIEVVLVNEDQIQRSSRGKMLMLVQNIKI